MDDAYGVPGALSLSARLGTVTPPQAFVLSFLLCKPKMWWCEPSLNTVLSRVMQESYIFISFYLFGVTSGDSQGTL